MAEKKILILDDFFNLENFLKYDKEVSCSIESRKFNKKHLKDLEEEIINNLVNNKYDAICLNALFGTKEFSNNNIDNLHSFRLIVNILDNYDINFENKIICFSYVRNFKVDQFKKFFPNINVIQVPTIALDKKNSAYNNLSHLRTKLTNLINRV